MRRLTCLLVCLAALLRAEDPEAEIVGLPELSVRGEAAVRPAGGSLRAGLSEAIWAPEVRLAAQGSGAQTDLSVRGSTFSGAGLAVGGLSLRNPQTEHFNAEMPLPLDWLTDVYAVTGLDQAHAVSGHLVGSIAAEFAPIATGGQAQMSLSEAGGHEARLTLSEAFGGTPWAGSLFVSDADLPGRDYAHNASAAKAGAVHLQYRDSEDRLDTALAVQNKAFGARGFYGVSPTLPSTEETLDVLLLGAWRHDLGRPGEFTRISLAMRRFEDEYTMTDRAPRTYRNDHRTLTSSAATDGRVSDGEGTGLSWRAFLEDERIDSQGLLRGAPTEGLGEHARQRLGLMLLPFRRLGPLTVEAGGQAVFFSEDAPVPLALAGLRWAVTDTQEAYLSYTETVRQPSFTELDYESPASLGNEGLENEESTAIEAGWRAQWSPALRTRLAVFRRTTEHTVDWLRLAPGGRWLATDVGDVVTRGVEAEASWDLGRTVAVTVFGTLLRKEDDARYYASRYVFDYPEERLGAALSWCPTEWCELRTAQAALWYAENPARGGDRAGTEADLQLILRPPARSDLSLTLACTNLFDDRLEIYPGQRRAARTVYGSVAFAW